jgi:hypothetical protein
MAQGFTDAQIQEILNDPRFTEEDLNLLSPAERGRVPALRKPKPTSTMQKGKELISGVAKGAGESAFNLGNAVNSTPILGDITGALAKLVGPEGTDPDAAFSKTPDVLKAKTGAEDLGKSVEQMAEFFLPTGPGSKILSKFAPKLAQIANTGFRGAGMEAAASAAVPVANAIPKATGALNKAIPVVGKMAGDGAQAAGTAALHGDENPEIPGLIGAAAPAMGAAGKGVAGLLATPFGRQVGPYIAAILAMQGLGGATGAGLSGSMGAFALSKAGANQLLKKPQTIPSLRRIAGRGAESATTATAGAYDHIRRRRLEGDSNAP